MKYIGVFILTLLWCNCVRHKTETSWIPVKIDDQLTVALPAKPQEVDVPGTMAVVNPERRQDAMVKNSQAYTLQDTAAIYVVVRIPLAEEPVVLPTFEERKNYYIDRAIPIMLGGDYPNLLEQSITQQDDIDLITVKYKAASAEGLPVIKYIRCFTVGKVVYQLHFLPLRQSGDFKEAERMEFFNSIQL
ncbi:hypothetical protein [Hymenobacter fodinae]|uniref:Uncharacterized protein n=1 Tax=Hymenobacter fodinae TaxID=2510796 RepID=A0A4Z0P3J4_9BACT|nr:hypothetical protein [Hymenobacter fodinae]TGE05528.1 hypothetical protein EU556_19700 [Hymenobacter fodinae]